MHSVNKLMITAIFLCSTVFAGCQTKDENTGKPETSQVNTQTEDSTEIVVKVNYYPSGAVETETEYVNGVRNGMHKLYDEDGNLISEVKYVNNKKEGMMKTYYSDGTLKVTVNYVHGLAHGEFISYYPDGKIWRKQMYDQGKLLSTKEYSPEGKLEFEEVL